MMNHIREIEDLEIQLMKVMAALITRDPDGMLKIHMAVSALSKADAEISEELLRFSLH